jgi:hypothetical protein
MAKPVPEHQDVLGQELKVDDCVAFADSGTMFIGKIKKLNPKLITIAKLGGMWSFTIRKYPSDIVRLEDEAVTFYLLNH